MTTVTCDEHPRHKAGCARCRTRAAAYGRARHRTIAYGTHRGWQDPTPARVHAERLRDEYGMSARRIAEVAGVSGECVRQLLNGEASRLHPRTYDRILAVRAPGEQHDADRVPALGAARMLQALTATGHPIDKLAAEMGARTQEVARWRRLYRPTIAAATDRRVREVYQRLSNTDGGCERTRAYARRMGYAPVGAWDCDDDLDRPDAAPDVDAVREPTARVLAGELPIDALTPAERLRVMEYLVALRWTDRQIAERTRWRGGRTSVSSYRWRQRIQPGRRRGDRLTDEMADARRRCAYRQLSTADQAARLVRLALPGEPPARIARAVGCSARTAARFLAARSATVDAVADEEAVRQALNGELPFTALSEAERLLLFREFAPSRPEREVARALRISGSTYRTWMSRAGRQSDGVAA